MLDPEFVEMRSPSVDRGFVLDEIGNGVVSRERRSLLGYNAQRDGRLASRSAHLDTAYDAVGILEIQMWFEAEHTFVPLAAAI
jgi:hypothetical protein